MTKLIKGLISLTSIMSMPGAIEQASAQEAEQAAGVLEEVVVTAARRAESLQDVGLAVTAVDPSEFSDIGLDSIGDLIDYTPGINFISDAQPGTGQINMRGVSREVGSPIVAIYVDDVPFTTGSALSLGGLFLFDGLFNDVERVEMIKGAQGTLYGANSVAGVVRYITRDPALDEVRGNLTVDYSQFDGGGDNQRYNGTVSFPVVEGKLGVTISGFYIDQGGYIDQVDFAGNTLEKEVNDAETEGYRIAALWAISDTASLEASYLNSEAEFEGSFRVEANFPDLEPTFGDYKTITGDSPTSLEFESFAATLDVDFGWATATLTAANVEFTTTADLDITAALGPFLDTVFDPAGAPHTAFNITENGYDKDVYELRLTSPDDESFEWIVGAFYADETGDNSQNLLAFPEIPGIPNPGFGSFNLPNSFEEFSIFANGTYYVTPDFDLSAGLRYSDSEVGLNSFNWGIFVNGIPDPAFADTIDDTIKEDTTTYAFGARWRRGDDTSLYARIASGYRPGFVNIPLVNPVTGQSSPPIVDSDEMWSYEVGVKGNTAEGTLTYDVALWYMVWEDFQANLDVGGIAGAGNSPSDISGYGLEVALGYNPQPAFNIRASFAYANSELDDDAPELFGESGDQTRFIPEVTASLIATYFFNIGSWDASLGGGIRHKGEFDVNYSLAPEFEVDAATQVDLNARFSNGNFAITLYANNLTNEYVYTTGAASALAPGLVTAFGVPLIPRTLGASLSYNF